MSKKKKKKEDPLKENILRIMTLLNNQVAREMQRTPSELAQEGVKKWEPYRKRVELITALVLETVGEDTFELDSLLILTRSMAKALYLLTDELGPEGLGTIRSSYFLAAAREVEGDMRKALDVLEDKPFLMS